MSITIALHWWYVPIVFLMIGAFFYVRLWISKDDNWVTEAHDFVAMFLCLFIAVVTLFVGWWAS